MQLRGARTVVTGAARGIGLAIARRFCAEGAKVVVSDVDAAALDDAVAQLRVHGDVVGHVADVSTESANAGLVQFAREHLGAVDLFFANAGIMGGGLEATEDDWRRAFDVNVNAHRWAARHLLPEWLERGFGYFCSTASAAGLLSQIGSAPYTLTKHAAVAWAEWLAITYGDAGLRVSCLCPQGVDTDMLRGSGNGASVVRAAGNVLHPDEVADAVVAAIDAETFLILPHPEVARYVAAKSADRDAWIAGMRRLQRRTTGG